MTQRLLVREPFGTHEFGDRITDPEEIRRVLASHPQHVLREAEPEEAEAEAAPAKAPSAPRSTQSAAAPAPTRPPRAAPDRAKD
jgi:hypothetical protein